MSNCVSILRIGPFPDNSDCANTIKTALLNYFSKKTSVNEDNGRSDNLITLSNKYFTAKVLLEEIGSNKTRLLQDSMYHYVEDGIILVFDSASSNPNAQPSTPASFDAMNVIHDQAVHCNDNDCPVAGDLLRLCVGVGKNYKLSTKAYEEEYSRRVLWCLDRGYEYVEADTSEEGLTSGHDARDKEGFARIVEALSGTIWSSAVMEKRKQVELISSYAQDATENAELEAADATNQYEPPNFSRISKPPSLIDNKVKKDEECERLARDALLSEDVAIEDAGSDCNVKLLNEREEEVKQERALHALEASLQEARRIRELSVSGKLSDVERRQRAADAAMTLMGMMGLDDDNNDDDDNDEEDVLQGNM